MSKALNGMMSITRPTCGGLDDDEQYISIKISDDASHNEFLEVRMSYADFTKAITGQSTQVKLLPHKLEVVGKRKIIKELVFEIPTDTLLGKVWAAKHAHKFADEGWVADTYFGSQRSIVSTNGKTYAHGRQYQYVDEE